MPIRMAINVMTLNGAFWVEVGSRLKVRYASRGTQLAVIEKISEKGIIYARKYRKNCREWTKTAVKIEPCQILGFWKGE